VSGVVEEYRPGGGSSDNLTTTEISGSPTVTVVGPGTLPAPVVIGDDRTPPSDVIDDDATGSVETSGTFDAATDGIDFWESMEGMVLGIEDARAVGPTNQYGELPVVAAGAEPATPRGGLYVSPDDFNPERVIIDDDLARTPEAHTGDTLAGTTVGVLDYSFANFKLLPWETGTVVSGNLTRESTDRARGSQLAIASYNVENLDAGDPVEKFDALAEQIVHNLRSPDVIGLEEVQDDSGPTDDGTTTPARTLDMLTEAISRAGGPAYAWRQIDPVDGEEGGQPGGNIRVAFLYNTDRGVDFVDRGTPTSTTAASLFVDGKGDAHLETSPARVAPDSPAWDDSRVPLVGEFTWKGRTFFAVANHFSSKGGDDPLFGRWQPAQRTSEVGRHQQAREVRELVDDLLAADPDARVAVLGDINDFEFSETVDILVGSGDTRLTDLPRTLPEPEQYTYVYQGNSQVLDHILLSPQFMADTVEYDIVHVNAEFADQISDHDPQVVRIGNPNRRRP
jgi:predicted extracellular nuclease